MLFDLHKARDSIIKYADVLSQVLKVDVEIVDVELKRIAATGKFKYKMDGLQTDESHIFKKIIETGKMLVIDKPGYDESCIGCSKYKKCDETFEMSTPIIYEGVAVGAIGFICFDEKQRSHIIDNFTTFQAFLEQISELIVSKVIERMDYDKNRVIVQMFESIFETIEDGILVIDSDDRITNHNEKARVLLNKADTYLNGEIIHVKEVKRTDNHSELVIKIGDTSIQGIGMHVSLSIDPYHKVIILKDVNAIKSYLSDIKTLPFHSSLDSIIGQSPVMIELKKKVHMIASSNSTVLITGESGTGKELFARAIHDLSDRSEGPFVAVNCGALPENLIESELFGYVKGAFTGADASGKRGKFSQADGGTIFLDEIGEMPIHLQVKILRVLEDMVICPLGSADYKHLDIRVIAATNRKLNQEVKEKRFRGDLYYRLNVIPIKLPPLRERKSDLRLLSLFFLKKYEGALNKTIDKIDITFWKSIERYDWKGNIRELQNVIEYALNIIGQETTLTSEHLPPSMMRHKEIVEDGIYSLETIEKTVICKALKTYGGYLNKTEIAQKLGVGIATLYRKIEKYNLSE